MKKLRIMLVVLMAGLVTSVTSADDAPGLRLGSFNGDRIVTVAPEDPLLLWLTIEHFAANRVRDQNQINQRLLDAFRQTEDYQRLSEAEREMVQQDYPILPLPDLVLGSAGHPTDSLVSFLFRDANGRPVNLDIRPMAANRIEPASSRLNPSETLYYQFGVASGVLQAVPAGVYSLAAALDTRALPGMWQGLAFSDTLQIKISDSHPDTQWARSRHRQHLHTAFLLADQQFTAAERSAREWISSYPDSVAAWHHLGEALVGLQDSENALKALNTALQKFRLKHGDRPVEMPDETLDLIRAVEEE